MGLYSVMEIKIVIKKGYPVYVRQMKVCDIDQQKIPKRFFNYNLPSDTVVNLICDSKGKFSLRGNKQEYRMIPITDDTEWEKISTDLEVVKMLYDREQLEKKIIKKDDKALINYEILKLER